MGHHPFDALDQTSQEFLHSKMTNGKALGYISAHDPFDGYVTSEQGFKEVPIALHHGL